MTEEGTRPPKPRTAGRSRGSLVLSDVFLLTADSNGQVAVPDLAVVLDGSGLTVLKPDGAAAAAIAWPDVSALQASGRMRTPAGSPGVVVEAVTPARTHRFVVPTDDPDGLEREIARAARGRGGTRRSGVLVGALVVLVVAVIALVVLLAIGTVKF